MSNTSMTPSEFARLLDVYGGDRARWPADARAAAAHLVARDVDAQRLLAEAEALDRVLGSVPLPALATEAALADRIVAAAQRSPRVVAVGGVRPVAPGSTRAVSAPRAAAGAAATSSGGSRSHRLRGKFGAAGVLAASLLVGVVIGNSSLPQQMLPGLVEIAGLAPDNLTQIALYDEDQL